MDNVAKLGPRAQWALQADPGGADRRVDFMLATVGRLSPEQKDQLGELGCELRTVAGDVVTASAALTLLPKLVSLDFVRYLELPSQMHLESR
jgi:hypothetical protein